MKPHKVLCLIAPVLLAACGSGSRNANLAQPVDKMVPITSATPAATAAIPSPTPVAGSEKQREACYSVKAGKKSLLRSQTFAIDFEPFRRSCFVTLFNPDYPDPPLDSEYAIYTNGRRTFDFPERFNGATFGCWVEGVGFQDVNRDNLTDIIVVGKCSAKTAPYYENMVFINDGKKFVTHADGNNKLGELKTIKEIADFAEENQQIFYK